MVHRALGVLRVLALARAVREVVLEVVREAVPVVAPVLVARRPALADRRPVLAVLLLAVLLRVAVPHLVRPVALQVGHPQALRGGRLRALLAVDRVLLAVRPVAVLPVPLVRRPARAARSAISARAASSSETVMVMPFNVR